MKSLATQNKISNGFSSKEVLQLNGDGPCTVCGTKSACKCERCGDFYCSPQCQRKDWPNHRYICFPMPRLIKACEWSSPTESKAIESNIPLLRSDRATQEIQIEEKQNAVGKTHPEDIKFPINEEKQVVGRAHPAETKFPINESCVILTGFKTTNRCCIRSTSPTDVENYKKIVNEIDAFGRTAPVLSGNPKINSYALTLRDNKWCRVQIFSNLPNKTFRVQFVDYGDFSTRSPKDLREINQRLISLPCFVHVVQLKDVMFVSTKRNHLELLLKYTNQEYKFVLDKKDHKGGNALFYNWRSKALLNAEINKMYGKFNGENKDEDVASNVSSISNTPDKKNSPEKPTSTTYSKQHNGSDKEVNSIPSIKTDTKPEGGNLLAPSTIITNKKTRTPPFQIQALKPCLEPPFKIIPLNEADSNVNVIITDDSYIEAGYIGCLLEKYYDNLKAITLFLKEHDISDQPYKPKLNEYCLATFENEWYRAKVVDVTDDNKYRVVYIDFTNEMELTSNSIRRYPMSLTLPCHTTLCGLEGLPGDLSDNLIQFLSSECYAFKELRIDNVRVVENICYVESKELLKKLHDNKLI